MSALDQLLATNVLPFIVVIVVVAIGSIVFAFFVISRIRRISTGTPRMEAISTYIRQGCNAYLKREYITITIIGVIIAALLAAIIDYSKWAQGEFSIVSVAYLVGIGCSLFAGYIAMYTSTMANVRAASRVKEGGMIGGLKVAFDGGLILGLLIVSLSLISVVIMTMLIAPFVADLSGI